MSSEEYKDTDIVSAAAGFLCDACDAEMSDLLWVVFESIRLKGMQDAREKELKGEQ